MPEDPGNRILWRPRAGAANRTQIAKFLDQARTSWAPGADDYPSLWRASVADPEGFWGALWSFSGVIAEGDTGVVVENPDRMPGARWFPHTRLNFAENLLRCGSGPDSRIDRGISRDRPLGDNRDRPRC